MTLLIETQELAAELSHPDLVLVDVRSEEHYAQGHIPGARRLEYASIVRQQPPVGGLLPDAAVFNAIAQGLGIAENSNVVAYDGEGSAAASRLIWTLHAFGFCQARLLNGGITAWVTDGRPVSLERPVIEPSSIELALSGDAVISAEDLMQEIERNAVQLLDARTVGEFTGTDVRANHGGRIPGAIHYEWSEALDRANGLRLFADEQLNNALQDRGIQRDKPVVVYCQTHHRSSLSYTMLKHLGYETRALDGAWSNWGNREDTPKETG